MHAVLEAKEALRAILRDPDEQKSAWIRRAGAFFGLTYAQAKKIEYLEIKDLRASRLDHIREKLQELEERAAARRVKGNEIRERLAEVRSSHGSGNPGLGSGGDRSTGGRSAGARASGSRAGERPAAAEEAEGSE